MYWQLIGKIEASAVGTNVYVGARSIIGPRCIIKDNCYIEEGTVLASDTVIPPFSRVRGNPAKVVDALPPSAASEAPKQNWHMMTRPTTLLHRRYQQQQQQQQQPLGERMTDKV
jgi:carbonic anhydrase/acetyltransferase-like protein (isoleucine patch superfamily)